MTDATQIRAALPTFSAAATASPAHLTVWTKVSPSDALATLRGLPERLDDSTLAMVDEIGRSGLPAMPPCSPEHFSSCLRSLSILPRRADDDCTGEQRVKIYGRLLGEFPADALSHMTRAALERCRWFPSPSECLTMAQEWKRNDDGVQAITVARRLSEAERRARFDDLCAQYKALTAEEIDALSEVARRHMEARMLLWRLPSGRYVPRTCSWPDALTMDQEIAA